MLCVQQKLYTLARQIVEAYLATIPEGMLIHLETAAGVSLSPEGPKDPLMTNYERLVELYLIHVLAKLGEWTSATDFLQYNTVLSESSKKVLYTDRTIAQSRTGERVVREEPENREKRSTESRETRERSKRGMFSKTLTTACLHYEH